MKISNIFICGEDAIQEARDATALNLVENDYRNLFIRNNLAGASFKVSRSVYNDPRYSLLVSNEFNTVTLVEKGGPMVASASYDLKASTGVKPVLNRKNFSINIIPDGNGDTNELATITIDAVKYRLVYYYIEHGDIINTYRRKESVIGCVIKCSTDKANQTSIKMVVTDRATGIYYNIHVFWTKYDGMESDVTRIARYNEKDENKRDKYFRAMLSPTYGIPTDVIIVNVDKCKSHDKFKNIPNTKILEVSGSNIMDVLEKDIKFRTEMSKLRNERYRAITLIDFDEVVDTSFYRDYKILYAFAMGSGNTYKNLVAIKSN